MQDSREEIARRILEDVLRQLEGGAAQAASVQAGQQAGTQNTNGSPIIIVMLGNAAPPASSRAECGCQNNSPGGGKNSLQLLHPSLERFDLLEGNTHSSGPRKCVVEPDRDCVGSGACEMRGY
ncbi:MAG TPA: hypothetical protein VKA60_22440 [Blastocatellia bacterium]|nr:hypothetical protein [Blastocatellia bacterium]